VNPQNPQNPQNSKNSTRAAKKPDDGMTPDSGIIRVHLVDDDPDAFVLVRDMLEDAEGTRCELTWSDSYTEGMAVVMQASHDVHLVDYLIGEPNGLKFIEDALGAGCQAPLILLTGAGGGRLDIEALTVGAADYLSKDKVDGQVLGRTIRYALERKRAQDSIHQGEARFRRLVEHAGDAFLLHDLEGKIVDVNQRACDSLGYSREELLELPIDHIDVAAAESDFPTPWARMGSGMGVTREAIHLRKDGSTFPVEVRIDRFDAAGGELVLQLARDVTERKRLEHRLRQGQKMEALGQLAGGVAHDFNNLLTAIMGYCQLSLNSAPVQSRLEANLKEIARAADRASGLTRQLLAFSSRQVIETRIFDINDLILDMDKMMARLIGENIELVTLPTAKPGSVKADPGQMETVLVNLLVNARDAMPDGGKLVIETENVTTFTGPSSENPSDGEPGDMRGSAFIKISVSDDGTGMSDAVKARVFEPFFTTKAAGRGTGLGLSTCYGVISRLGGRISVDSAEGVGTRIDVLLPAAGGEIAHSVTRTEPELINVGRESLMLVEDEESVRKVVAQALRSLGYQVMEAANGRAALELSDLLDPDGIDLLITDVIMPGMSGRDLADEFTARWPETKVLFVSGYTDGISELVTGDGRFTYMGKPFTPNALSAKVREVLNNPEAEAKSA